MTFSIADVKEWLGLLLMPVVSAVTFIVLLRAKQELQALSITVNGRLTALLEAREAEAVAKIAAASLVGEATGRAAERNDKNAELVSVSAPVPPQPAAALPGGPQIAMGTAADAGQL